MDVVVQKFGGTSVANLLNLQKVVNHIIKEYKKGSKVVVVVSAQGDMTDNLILEEKEITNNPNLREHDALVSIGEQITATKLAMLLEKLGYKAISYTGWQIPIITDSNFGNANIIDIKKEKIIKELENNKIVIVTGFQGIDENNNITTLGRGGSDTTAVALAATLEATRCDIFTDVDGVYSSDPNLDSNAIKFDNVSYEKMLNMANHGAKVLHNKSVEIAKKHKVKIYVKSTFINESVGTLIN